MSLGTGRPIVLRDESSIRHCRLLLSHPMASPTDVRLIALVELIAQKSKFCIFRYFSTAPCLLVPPHSPSRDVKVAAVLRLSAVAIWLINGSEFTH